MILNNKVSQRLEIIGFKGSVKKLTSRIQVIIQSVHLLKMEFEEVNTLDIEKIKSYYNQIRNEDLCDCDYCRNNIHEVQAAYPTSFIDIP